MRTFIDVGLIHMSFVMIPMGTLVGAVLGHLGGRLARSTRRDAERS